MTTASRFLSAGLIGLFSVGILISIGCKPASDGSLELLDTKLSSLKIDDLARTMDFVFSGKRFEQEEFVRNVTSGVNRWTRSTLGNYDDDNFKVDDLEKPLMEEFSDLPLTRDVPEMNFVNTDPYYFQQTAWLKKIASRISKDSHLGPFELQRLAADEFEVTESTENALAEVMAKLHDGLSDEEAVDLANGMRAFDWVVRNIYLESDPEAPGDDPLMPGLGYRRFPWQVLIYSRGDYVERAKTFMLLAEQMGLQTVMLSVGEGEDRKYWCPALLVGGKAYLFDTKLGLPIPSKKPGAIATLSEVRENPDILTALNLSVEESLADDTDYWVVGDDLENIEALIYTSPEKCSRRMMHLEKNLTGDYALTLASQPEETAKVLPEMDGLSHKAWDVGFKTHQFRQALRGAISESAKNDVIREKIRWHFMDESYIDSFSVYRTGRARYFNGRFTIDGKRRTAIQSFYALMYSDQQIADLATDTMLQRQLGILKDKNASTQAYMQRVKGVQGQMKLVRRDAAYFLAQCHFDKGNIGTAANWLRRMLNKDTSPRWVDGANYLLARSLEARGEYDSALEYYEKSKGSEQNHGNLIRKRMLQDLVSQLK